MICNKYLSNPTANKNYLSKKTLTEE